MQQEWLQLAQSKGLSIAAKRKLVNALGSPGAVLQATPDMLVEVLVEASDDAAQVRRVSGKAARMLKQKCPSVASDLALLQRIGGDFIGFTASDFPPLLNHIQNPPLGLFVLGERALLSSSQIAIVGSRSPTPGGRHTTQQLAAELSVAGLTITSGLACGIDGYAHRGCLDAGGKTIAVMATGLELAYPRAHGELYQAITEHGLLVTEYPPATPPRREYFPQRNRIISGLSLGTVVVEAGIRSGSLITARLAGEQGREVFAVPGSIYSAVSRGCHQLLRQGAKLVESSADIVDEISPWSAAQARGDVAQPALPAAIVPSPMPHGAAAQVYNLIEYATADTDQLIEQSGLTADEVSYILMQLELGGWIVATASGYQRLPQSQPLGVRD